MTPKARRREEARQHILNAATAVFARKGLLQTSMSDIMAESGLSKGGIYWHFKSKNDIITAIMDTLFDQEADELVTALQMIPSPTERMLTAVDYLAEALVRYSDLMPVTFDFYAAATRDEQMRQTVNRYFAGYQMIYHDMLQYGVDQGVFRPMSADAVADMALVLTAQTEGTILMWLLKQGEFDLKRQFRMAMTLSLEGLNWKD